MQIVKVLTANKILTSKVYYMKHDGKTMPENLYRWNHKFIAKISRCPKYTSCTFNSKTYSKFHKPKNIYQMHRISQADTADKRLKLPGTFSEKLNWREMNSVLHDKKAGWRSPSTMPPCSNEITFLWVCYFREQPSFSIDGLWKNPYFW